jgi:hypothetical protein
MDSEQRAPSFGAHFITKGDVTMKTTQRFCLLLVLVLAVAALAAAADIEGILVDRMCSTKIIKEGQKAAQAHTRECALMPHCLASGYGVYTAEGKFLTFDAAGNKQAEQALRASKKRNHLRVVVSGQQSGDTIQVTSLKLL